VVKEVEQLRREIASPDPAPLVGVVKEVEQLRQRESARTDATRPRAQRFASMKAVASDSRATSFTTSTSEVGSWL
jgi:hypothetical protein